MLFGRTCGLSVCWSDCWCSCLGEHGACGVPEPSADSRGPSDSGIHYQTHCHYLSGVLSATECSVMSSGLWPVSLSPLLALYSEQWCPAIWHLIPDRRFWWGKDSETLPNWTCWDVPWVEGKCVRTRAIDTLCLASSTEMRAVWYWASICI